MAEKRRLLMFQQNFKLQVLLVNKQWSIEPPSVDQKITGKRRYHLLSSLTCCRGGDVYARRVNGRNEGMMVEKDASQRDGSQERLDGLTTDLIISDLGRPFDDERVMWSQIRSKN
jgi:hypothetical protein